MQPNETKSQSGSRIVLTLALLVLINTARGSPMRHQKVSRCSNPCGDSFVDETVLSEVRHDYNSVKKVLEVMNNKYVELNATGLQGDFGYYAKCGAQEYSSKTLKSLRLSFKRSMNGTKQNNRKMYTRKWLHEMYEDQMGRCYQVEKLKTTTVQMNVAEYNEKDRLNALDKFQNMTRSILCEIETAINATGDSLRPNNHRLGRIKKAMDYTRTCIYDLNQLYTFKNSLKAWRAIRPLPNWGSSNRKDDVLCDDKDPFPKSYYKPCSDFHDNDKDDDENYYNDYQSFDDGYSEE